MSRKLTIQIERYAKIKNKKKKTFYFVHVHHFTGFTNREDRSNRLAVGRKSKNEKKNLI